MKVNIITAFPNLIKNFFDNTIIQKAIENSILEINVLDLRDFSTNNRKDIDDYPFGGGAGMLLRAEPIYKAFNSLKNKGEIIYPSPQGIMLNHNLAKEFSEKESLTMLCGHYEGIDERVFELFEITEVSIGDYVLSGGELPSLVILDSILRLVPGVIKDESKVQDSFYNNLLDNPSYTKPREFEGKKVPDVLISGNHSKIEEWKKRERIKRTFFRRPELLKGKLNKKEKEYLKELYEEIINS